MNVLSRLAATPFQPEEEYRKLVAESTGMGAVATFTGIARPQSLNGEKMIVLRLDHHSTLTLNSLNDIARAAGQAFTLISVRVVHRIGDVAAGDPIVFVGATSAHRKASMAAVDYMMDRLKTEAFFWKCELTSAGPQWIEPTAQDYASAATWKDENGGN